MDKNIAALLDTSAYTVDLFFSAGQGAKPKMYKYVCNIPGINPGDWVIIDGPDFDNYVSACAPHMAMQSIDDAINGGKLIFSGVPKVVIVASVDDCVNIEPNSDIKLKWIISKVDTAGYVETLQRVNKISSLVADAYKKSMRRSFADRILADLDGANKAELLVLLGKPEAAATPE